MTAGLFAVAAAAGAAFPICAQSQQQQPPPDQTQTPSSQPDQKTDKSGKDAEKPAPKSTTVKGVVVTAASPPVRVDIDRRSYDISKDLETQAGASIADALRNVPSVDVDLDGKVTLRGQSGVTILVDGKPSPMINPDTIQNLPADQFERVEVMTNPSAAFSPEGTAGIINLVTKKRLPAGRQATIKLAVDDPNRWRVGAFGSMKMGPLTVSLNGSANEGARSSARTSVVRVSTPPTASRPRARTTATPFRNSTPRTAAGTYAGTSIQNPNSPSISTATTSPAGSTSTRLRSCPTPPAPSPKTC